MAQEDTDYWLLSVVAVVGLVAIVAMHQLAFSPGGVPFSFETPVYQPTGAATGIPARTLAIPRSSIPSIEGDWDYTGDGRLTEDDSYVLADALSSGVCPHGKDCDLNNDGALDDADLGLFNVEMFADKRSRASPLTGNVVAQNSPLQYRATRKQRVATRLA